MGRADARLSRTQRLFTRLLPSRAAEIERQSREWIVTCDDCGHATDIWQLGGVRYGARSKGKRILMRCPNCRRRSWARVVRHVAG